jgi:excisionase family DNA binding protein
MRRDPLLGSGVESDCDALASEPGHPVPSSISFSQRLTCTVAEACEVTGLGRTKLYELIGDDCIATTSIGRRRLVLVQSLLTLVRF